MPTIDYDPFDVFDIDTGKRRAEAPEHLAELQQYYEITINIPQDKMTLVEHIDCYKNVWAHLKTVYKSTEDLYFVEYCKSGQAHIHGYLKINYPVNAIHYDDEHFLKDVARTIFKILPKKYWKQFTNAKILPFYRKLVTPAVCLNMKNILSTNWIEYIEKNVKK